MSDFCSLIVAGRISKVPVIRKSKSTVFTELSIAANNNPVYSKDQSKIERFEPTFIDVTFYGTVAERMAALNLDKGTSIVVSGELQTKRWKDSDTGLARQKLFLKGRIFFVSDSREVSGYDDGSVGIEDDIT